MSARLPLPVPPLVISLAAAVVMVSGCAATPSLNFADDDASTSALSDASPARDADRPGDPGADAGSRDASAN